jgi:hypothetical protein
MTYCPSERPLKVKVPLASVVAEPELFPTRDIVTPESAVPPDVALPEILCETAGGGLLPLSLLPLLPLPPQAASSAIAATAMDKPAGNLILLINFVILFMVVNSCLSKLVDAGEMHAYKESNKRHK